MQTKTLVKIAALGGILSVVLQMIGQMFIQVGGQEPAFNAELDEIVSFFMNRDPRMAVTGSFLSVLSFIPFIFFLGVLWKKLNATEEKFRWLSAITLGAGLLIVAVQITGGAGWTTLFYRLDGQILPEMAGFQFDYGNFLFAASWVMMASMLLSAGILSIATGALPKWIGWFGLVTSLGLLIAAGYWFGPSGVIFVPVTLFWIWLICVSVVLFRWAGKEE